MTRFRPLASSPARLFVAALVSMAWIGCSGEAGEPPTAPGAEFARGGVAGPPQEFGPALEAQERHGARLMATDGVVGHGVGLGPDGEPGITVFTLQPGVQGIPAELDGVPVRVKATGMFVAGGTTDRTRPAPNGYSVGHPDITAGTLGAVVQGSDDVCYILSNNHVLANSNDANIGDSALQPGPVDGGSDPTDAIGALTDWQPIAFDGSTNQIDAAIAEIFTTADVTAETPPSPTGYGAPGTSVVSASVQQKVQKYGRTTQLTKNEVLEISVSADVCYECAGPFCFNCKKLAHYEDLIATGDMSDGGDSGSLVVTDDAGKNPVGLLFAGSSTRTLLNRIDLVLNRFGASVTADLGSCKNDADGGGGGGSGDNTAPSASFTSSCTDLSCDFDASGSSDSDGSIASWDWDFGDGNAGSGELVSHTYDGGGTYTVTLTVTDDEGATDSDSQDVTLVEPGDFSLSATGYKERGLHKADLEWSGATSADVDVYRDGALIATIENDGDYTDHIDQRGSASYTYRVCEAGTTTCSNEATVDI